MCSASDRTDLASHASSGESVGDETGQSRDPERGRLFASVIDRHVDSLGEACVLDAGCKYGALTFGMADRVGEVVGIDVDREAVAEANVAAQDYVNVTVSEGSILDTDFTGGVFDVIVLEGVLEWLGNSDPDSAPIECQRRVLRECRRLLGESGLLYIGIENRLCPYFWVRPPHSGVPLAPLFPKRFSQPLHRILTGEYYGEHILSYWGYERLLSESFSSVGIGLPIPHYKYPYDVSGFDPASLRSAIQRGRSDLDNKELPGTYRQAMSGLYAGSYLGVNKFLAPNFVILCRP